MKNSYSPCRFRLLISFLFGLLVTGSALAADLTVTGNLTVTGTTNSAGAIDSDSNTFTFGTQGTSFGGSLLYQDNNVDTLTFGINRSPASWLWQHNSGIKAMRLDSAHQLLLFNAAGTTAGITLTPVSNQISLGTATLTGSGANITVGGALTAQSSIINNGTITGGATGLTLNAGGSNQNITLTPSGTGNTLLNGNVGIGVSSPAGYGKLAVAGAIATLSPDNGTVATIQGDNTGLVSFGAWRNATNTQVRFNTGNSAGLFTEKMRIDQNGNVGIGTTSPSAKLDVIGSLSAAGAVTFNNNTSTLTAGPASTVLQVGGSDSATTRVGIDTFGAPGQFFGRRANGTNASKSALINGNQIVSIGAFGYRPTGYSPGGGGYLLFTAAQDWSDTAMGTNFQIGLVPNGSTAQTTVYTFYNDGSIAFPNFSITSAGDVGIGTTSPDSSKLHVSGGKLNLDNDQAIAWGGGTARPAIMGNKTSGYLSFYTVGSERMRLDNVGNVGIGTTNPTQKLSVAGTVRAYAVIVDTGWSDYVFDESYRLAPLSEVEQHIKAEKHLPGIPSAAEVAEHGVSLGDMQSKLLAKIEELTLRQIAQEKQMNAQTARLTQIEEENRTLKTRLQSLGR